MLSFSDLGVYVFVLDLEGPAGVVFDVYLFYDFLRRLGVNLPGAVGDLELRAASARPHLRKTRLRVLLTNMLQHIRPEPLHLVTKSHYREGRL